ncbi:hypothetical protein [Prochlorococcus marinus]|uniref:hypothetical protein n=1 Tax=Prochlorococcus marinus TaxID=1219 RepID=UPI0022B2D889|nr:hypothetical protein [Prochlorococcus marinus]
MLKERIQEIFEFTKSESPYRKANKGWINPDIFLDLSPSADTAKQTKEDAKITLFWSPINSLLSNIFIIVILGSILVFTSVSFAKDRFEFNLFRESAIMDIEEVEENKVLDTRILKDIDSNNSTIIENMSKKDLDKTNKTNSLDDDLMKVDKKIRNKKIDSQDVAIIESQSNKDIKVLQNKKPKSNFI